MPFPVVFDACVLAPYPLANLLLRLADEGIYRPLWSQDIAPRIRAGVGAVLAANGDMDGGRQIAGSQATDE